MAAAINSDLDPVFRQALKYLHSSQTDAAENIRKALDEVIRQKHGSSKMLINTLNKKYIAEESKATGSGLLKSISSTRRSSHKSSDSSSNNSNSSPVQIIATTSGITTPTTTTVLATDLSGQTQEIPVIISIPDSTGGTTISAIDDNAMDTNLQHDFEDLLCVICRRIDLSAKNRLIECTKCNLLYHQECHSPQLKDADLANGQELTWLCSDCKGRSSTATSVSSSSSSSSSKKEKDKEHSSSKSKSSSSSSRHHSSHHSSSHSSKHERSSGSGSDKKESKSSAP